MATVCTSPADVLAHPEFKEALLALLMDLADDELTIGHRDSEWLGLAPDIEGDIAFSSIAQDEVGHATFFFDRICELTGEDADELAFARAADKRRNARLLERENGDWAETILRHYVYDVFDRVRLEALTGSSYTPLAEGAVKMLREEYYHLLHMETVLGRLSGGGEARQRVERALDALRPEFGTLFSGALQDPRLQRLGILTASGEEIAAVWQREVQDHLQAWRLPVPPELQRVQPIPDGRSTHTPALERMLKVMAEVYAANPSAAW
ncbi:1,2-phenylacetyl-CoA epoxidase subunit PaaC [Alicyclobacillus herbarius]|uniref:1,2-phenylacetyl-CoA epoxidase subunit PaaC n=1 Tax=Alicyclobacillus herbarius TaxID=122960 RepID=UPI0004252D13|nr:1,2-phenylacetyl-CoA epoxidase subunit PaaC [Alicyclobacillus herbarius]